MALQADANWHGESGRALLNPFVEDRNGWFGVRLLQVLEQARAAEDLAAEGAKLRVQVAYRGSAIVTFVLGSFFAKIADRIYYVPCFHYFALVFRIATIFANED